MIVRTLLAAAATWVTLLAWAGFAEEPSSFLLPLLGAVLLVAGTGALLRTARVPALLVAVAQLLVVTLWLHQRLSGGAGLAGLLPTPDSVRLAVDAVAEAARSAQTYSAPVPASAPEFAPLLIVSGTATALLVDLLAVGLRRAPLAGLPLLAAYTAPVSILDGGVPWPAFTAAALCFLALIAADHGDRLERWGRLLTPRRGVLDQRPDILGGGAVWSSARRIGITATALAVVAPVLLPGFDATFFDGNGRSGDGSGEGVSLANPMVDLKRDLVRGADVDLVTVRTRNPDPSYLRLTVLNTFDGEAWRPATRDIPTEQRADGTVAAPPGLETDVPRREYATDVRVSNQFESRWLPAPYPVSAIDAPGDWRYDRSTLDFVSAADGQTAAGVSYRMRDLVPRPSAADLASASAAPLSVFTPNTTLPKSFPEGVRRLAEQVTEGRASKFEQATALQQWFRSDGGFRYSLDRSRGNGTSDLVRFLREGPGGRVGYCEQFAAAMAVMGRSLGIPSRVAVGFLRPDRGGSPDTYVYSSHDLHSWPEMYFEGSGWVRFEPTPQDRTGDVPGYTTQNVPQAAPSSATSSAPTSSAPATGPNRQAEQQAAGATGTDGPSTGQRVLLVGAPVLALLAALLLAPRTWRSARRRRRWRAAGTPLTWLETAWLELRDTTLDLGLPWEERGTLRTAELALARRLDRAEQPDPEDRAALHRLVQLLERARYARSLPEGATTRAAVQADLDRCTTALGSVVTRAQRTRARWLPASLLVRSGARRVRGGGATPRRAREAVVDRAV